MSERMVVHSVAADAEPGADVARRLHAGGIQIVDQQPHMLLVEGDKPAIARALNNARGWSISPLTTVPSPRTREEIRRRP
jgi:hypothetical protein